MKAGRLILSLIIASVLFISSVSGQINIPDFSDRVNTYMQKNPGELIYVQTDREVYHPGDRMNVKAFVRDKYSNEASIISKNMHLILVDSYGGLQQEKIFKIENGQANGSYDILSGLPDGEYRLIAWTNEMESGPVENVFRKNIFIRDKSIPNVFIKLSAGQTTYLPGDIGQVRVELRNNLGNPLKRKKFSYTLSHNGSILESSEGRTDKEGKVNLDIAIPDIRELGIMVFDIAVTQAGSTVNSSIIIPTTKTPVWIDFAPEGGLLVNGFETKIGFKTYDFMGNSIDIEGELLDSNGNKVIDIKSDGLGFGTFTALAVASNPLKVRITQPSGIDLEFDLPEVQTNGVQLVLTEAGPEQLEFIVRTDINDASIPLHAVATVKAKLIFDQRFTLKGESSFSIPVEEIKQHQLINVNLLGRSGDVVAHRSVFVPGNDPVSLHSANLDDSPEKFPFEFQVSGSKSSPMTAPADLAVSSVNQNLSPNWSRVQDIMSWFILGPGASFASFPIEFLADPSEADKNIINCYSLFHTVDKYDWPNIKTGKKPDQSYIKSEFRDKLKRNYQTGDFEKLISQIRTNEFFRKHYLESEFDLVEFIRNNKNSLEKLGYLPVRMSQDEKVQQQLQQGKSIMSVLMSIKPYKLMDNKIVFRGNDSYNFQGGAIIVIDGVMRGTDPEILSALSPYDIESIKASANIADIQKYSGLNSTGVVEVTTKKGPKTETPGPIPQILHPTLLWDGQLVPDSNGDLLITIDKPSVKSAIYTVIQGIDSDGNFLVWKSK